MTTREGVTVPPPHDAERHRQGQDGARSSLGAQWTGFFLAPATFFAHLQLALVLVPWSCATGNHLWLNVVDALSVILAVIGTVIARRVWTADDLGQESGAGGPSSRARFLGISGAAIGGLLALILASQWAAAWIISPCQ
jgi:hypothetical protein